MPRLFTGLELPDDLTRDLAMVRGGLSGARWIDAENYHLTLRFIGDVGDGVAEEVHSVLARIRRPAFKVTIAGLDAFGGGRPEPLLRRPNPSPPFSICSPSRSG